MALVLSLEGLQQLQGRLPAPALVQEFVNHGGQQYKVYVLGEQVGGVQFCGVLVAHSTLCRHQNNTCVSTMNTRKSTHV
jgi:hypothetical protein